MSALISLLSPLQQAWLSREPRERRTLAIGAGIIVLLLGYLAISRLGAIDITDAAPPPAAAPVFRPSSHWRRNAGCRRRTPRHRRAALGIASPWPAPSGASATATDRHDLRPLGGAAWLVDHRMVAGTGIGRRPGAGDDPGGGARAPAIAKQDEATHEALHRPGGPGHPHHRHFLSDPAVHPAARRPVRLIAANLPEGVDLEEPRGRLLDGRATALIVEPRPGWP